MTAAGEHVVKIRLACPTCQRPGAAVVPPPASWRCPGCDHVVALAEPPTTGTEAGVILHRCAVCGGEELYKKKAFPHWLGVSLLAGACVAFLVLNYVRLQWWAWAILLASAVIDGLLYLMVRDAVVCYRCDAEHAGLGRSANAPFELTIQERYRQTRERLKAQG